MKKSLAILFFTAAVVFAQIQDQMIKTEYAFAKNAIEVGTRKSFLNFIANDGILFRPGPVNGKEFLEKSKDRSGFLFWYPSRAAIALAGDMGYTSGPWSFKNAKDSAEVAFGHFCTIWEKQNDGSFKFAIDYGISHKQLERKEIALTEAGNFQKIKNDENKIYPKVNVSDFDSDFSFSKQNLYNDESQLLVDGYFPLYGKEEIQKFFEKESINKVSYAMIGGKVSMTNDFGFTYGIAILGKTDETKKENYYFRVWKLNEKNWVILSETWNPKK